MNPESINHTENSEKTNNSESSKWDILAKYNEDERARVDKIKSEYLGGNIEEEPEVISPSTLRKMGRLVLDNLNITIPAVEKQRNREAESIAMKELRDEQQKNAERVRKEKAELDEETELRRIDIGLRDFADSIKSEERDKAQLAGRIADIRKNFDTERYNTARAQELLERDINASVVKVDELEALASGGYEGVEKTTEKYNEDIIPVYNLKGYLCDMLLHSVAYKISRPEEIGETVREGLAKKAIEDPSFWTKKKGEVEGGSNLLCTSYVDLSTFPQAFVHKPPIYGFQKIRANSVQLFTNGDANTGTDWYADPTLKGVAVKGIPTHIRPGSGYNELTIKRYSDDGEPLLPDYIVTENGEITDIDRKHAAYFKIPIVNIEQQYYKGINSGEKNGTTD